MITYKFGDIILVGFPHTDLRSASKRPAVVLYDLGDQDALISRITTQEYSAEADYKILKWKESGLLAESYIRLGKQATIGKQYIIKQLGKLEFQEIDNLRSILKKMFRF